MPKQYSNSDKRKFYTLQCRYFNGEDKEPDWMNKNESMFWFYEKCWVDSLLQGGNVLKELEDDIKVWNLTKDAKDKTPLTLKALLFGRYLHWSSGWGTIEDELKDFHSNVYVLYVTRKTNKERRTEQRTIELIEKCRYYKGERYNLWNKESRYSVLQDRRLFWFVEKAWVESIADSYSNRDKKQDWWCMRIVFATKYKVPATLLNDVMFALQKQNPEMDENQVAALFEQKYIRYTPLPGAECTKYMVYFFGDGEKPSQGKNTKDYGKHADLFHLQEQIYYGNCQQKGWEKGQMRSSRNMMKDCKEDDICADHWLDKSLPLALIAMGDFAVMNIGVWCPYESDYELINEYCYGKDWKECVKPLPDVSDVENKKEPKQKHL